jgi:ABC-type multidrug transport system ATPase subunit
LTKIKLQPAYNTGVVILLEAKSLTKHYGQTIALMSMDFQVQNGITGLLGPKGAGKSTAIKLFLGGRRLRRMGIP